MNNLALMTLIYGILVASGGIFGFLRAGSKISLITGAIFGTILIATSFFISDKWIFPKYLALCTALLLEIFFVYRFVVTFRFMPSGLMLLLSLIVIITLAIHIARIRPQ